MKSTVFLVATSCGSAPTFRRKVLPTFAGQTASRIKRFVSDDGAVERSSETSVNFYQTTWRHIPEVNVLCNKYWNYDLIGCASL
jgi:hypothetical protein